MLRYFWVTLAGLVGAACFLRAAEHFVFGGDFVTIVMQLALSLGFLGWSLQGFRRLQGTREARGRQAEEQRKSGQDDR